MAANIPIAPVQDLIQKSSLLNPEEKAIWLQEVKEMPETSWARIATILKAGEAKVLQLKEKFESGKTKIYENFIQKARRFRADAQKHQLAASEQKNDLEEQKVRQKLLNEMEAI